MPSISPPQRRADVKKSKRKIGYALLEGLGELLLTLLCFGIGALIVSLFGVDFEMININSDLIILLGVVIFLAVFLGMYALVGWIKRLGRGKDKQE